MIWKTTFRLRTIRVLVYGTGPNTEIENVVYNVETRLNSGDTKRKYPQIGEDIKVMGVRRHDKINLTIACATVSRFVKNEAEYRETRDIVHDIAQSVADRFTSMETTIKVNTADNFDKKLYYLTVTGTSAEHGDDGQVGRGNRANGLITPFRPMTLEAAAGKNPINHTGKIYNICASTIVCSYPEGLSRTGTNCLLYGFRNRQADKSAAGDQR